MPLRRWICHYQQLGVFERGRVIGLPEGVHSFCNIEESLANILHLFYFLDRCCQQSCTGMHLLRMIVGSSCQGKVLTQEDLVPGGYMILLSWKTVVCGIRLWSIVMRLQQKLELHLHHIDTTDSYKSITSRADPCQSMHIPLNPNHCHLKGQLCQARTHSRTE